MILLKTSYSKNDRLKALIYLYSMVPFAFRRGRAAGVSSEIDAIALIQIFVVLSVFSYFLYSGLKLGKEINRLWRFSPTRYLLLLNFFFFLSAFWSSDYLITLWRSIEWFFLLLSSSFLASNLSSKELSRFWWQWSLFNGALLSIVLIHGVSGDILSYHGVWVYYAAGILFYPWKKDVGIRDKIFMLALTILSTSSKVFVGIALAVLSWMLISKGKSLVQRLLSYVFASGLVAFLLNNLWLLFYGKSQSEIENGTGRSVVWEYALELIRDQFWLGYGFTAGEKQLGLGLGLNVVEAHNSLLSVMLSAGIFGLLLLLFSWFWLYVYVRRLDIGWLWMSLVCATVFMIFDNSFGTRVSPAVLSTWSLFFITRSHYEEGANN